MTAACGVRGRLPTTLDAMDEMPLLFPALLVLVVGCLEWRRQGGSRACARVALGAATALLIAAMRYPGESAAMVVEHTEDGLVYLVALARVLGVAAVLFVALGAVRARLGA
jgi:hypothetical protein